MCSYKSESNSYYVDVLDSRLGELRKVTKDHIDRAFTAFQARGGVFEALAQLQAAQAVIQQTQRLLVNASAEWLESSELTPKEHKLLRIAFEGGA